MSNSCGRTASLRRRPDRRPACHAQAPRSSRAGAHAVIAQPDVLARGRRTYWTVKPSACARRQRSVHILRQARPCPTASTSATRSKGMQPPWGRTRGFSASELRPSRTLVPSAVPEEWPGLPGQRTPEGPASVDGKSCTVDRARGKLGGLCAMRPWRTTFRPSRSPRPRGRCRHNDLLIPSSWPGPDRGEQLTGGPDVTKPRLPDVRTITLPVRDVGADAGARRSPARVHKVSRRRHRRIWRKVPKLCTVSKRARD